MDRTTARLAGRLVSYGLPLLYLLTSISFYLHTYDSAQVKITLVQMLGTVVIAFWYVKLLCERDIPWRKYAPIAAPLLAALFSGLLSFSHAAYPGPSLDECLRRVFYVHFALIALLEINTQQRLKRLVSFLLVAVAVAVAYGVIQYLDIKFFKTPLPGLDPFVWRQAFGSRVFSTFGNPNFFGNFLVILTPITLALMLKRHSDQPGSVLFFALAAFVVSAVLWQSERVAGLLHIPSWENAFFTMLLIGFAFWTVVRYSFLGLLFFLITLCNDSTQSKGAWIGYAAGFVAFLALVLSYFSQFRSARVKRVIQQTIFITVALCVVAVFFASRQRVDSIRFRVCTWVSTWEMGMMRPVWGNGIGSFRVLYPAFRRPQIFHIEGKHNTETDHAENEYWEVFMDEGIIGFGVFIWVIATFSLLGLRALRRFTEGGLYLRDAATGKRKVVDDPRAFYMLGILAAFWGMLVHNLMDVSLRFVSSGIFLWLLAGLIGAMTAHDPLPENDAVREKNEPAAGEETVERSHPSALLAPARAIGAALFGLLTYRILRQFHDAQGPTPHSFGEALLWSLAWAAVLGTVAAVWHGLYRVSRSLKVVYPFLILAAAIPPLYLFWGYFMADVHHNRGIYFSKQGKWDQAIENYRRVVELNPNYIMAYYFMGNVYTDRWLPGDVEKAMQEYRRVWAIAPNYVQSHHQAGLVYLKKGQDDRRLLDQLRSRPDAQAEAARVLADVKTDWGQALAFFHKYHGLDPVFEPNYARQGWVHMQLAELAKLEGRPAEAERHLEAAEATYQESLQAVVCGAPENDVLRERWDRTHRHWSAEMFENLGNTRYIRGRFPEAIRAYRMSLWKDDANIRVLKNLANVYARLGRTPDLTRTWERIRQLAPQDPDVQRVFSHGQNPPPRS